jgi:hypothetical protein
MLDGKLYSVKGLTDEAILIAIGQVLPEDVVCLKKPGGGFRFRRVEFSWPRDRYPWAPSRHPSPFGNERENESKERRDRKLLGLPVSTKWRSRALRMTRTTLENGLRLRSISKSNS